MASDQHFYFKDFSRKYFCKQNIFKIGKPVLAALSVNGLMYTYPTEIFNNVCSGVNIEFYKR